MTTTVCLFQTELRFIHDSPIQIEICVEIEMEEESEKEVETDGSSPVLINGDE